MHEKNNTLHLHSKLALEIKAAKKTMFRLHREGTSLREAADRFAVDIANRFEGVLPRNGSAEPHVSRHTGSTIEIDPFDKVEVSPLPWVERLTDSGEPEDYDALFNLLTYAVAVTEHGDASQQAVLDHAITEAWQNSEPAYELRRKQAAQIERSVVARRCDASEREGQ